MTHLTKVFLIYEYLWNSGFSCTLRKSKAEENTHFWLVGFSVRLLFELLHYYSSSRSLRSATDSRIFRVPRMGRKALGGGGGGGGGGDPFNTLDLGSGTLFLSLLGIRLHSLLLNQN